MADWHNTTSAKAAWRDAPANEFLQELLDVSKEEVIAFGADLGVDELGEPITEIPNGWRMAHLLHAKSIWTFLQSTANSDGASIEGVGGPRIYPMDANVRARIRPRTATIEIG